MRRTLPLRALLVLAVSVGPLPALADAPPSLPGAINAIVGDASFREVHGREPTPRDDEGDRIRTHLLWIEAHLRVADTSQLAPELAERRARSLDVLHAYALAGAFPRHDPGQRERRPRFIDAQGRICAVGRLIEASVGRGLAEDVAARHSLDYLADMRSHAALSAWAAASGFTLEELASIQPSYGWEEPRPLPRPPPREEGPRVSVHDIQRALAAARADAMQRCVVPSSRRAVVHVTVIVGTDGSIGVTARGVGAAVDGECVASLIRGQAIESGRSPPRRRIRVDTRWSTARYTDAR